MCVFVFVCVGVLSVSGVCDNNDDDDDDVTRGEFCDERKPDARIPTAFCLCKSSAKIHFECTTFLLHKNETDAQQR